MAFLNATVVASCFVLPDIVNVLLLSLSPIPSTFVTFPSSDIWNNVPLYVIVFAEFLCKIHFFPPPFFLRYFAKN